MGDNNVFELCLSEKRCQATQLSPRPSSPFVVLGAFSKFRWASVAGRQLNNDTSKPLETRFWVDQIAHF
jgi:hypothetical protein